MLNTINYKIEIPDPSTLSRIREKDIDIVSRLLRSSVEIKDFESVLIITDKYCGHEAELFFESVRAFSQNITYIKLYGMNENAQEPPHQVAEMMKNSNVCFMVTKNSLSHTMARKNANKSGTRIISMPGITKDMILRCFDVNHNELITLTDKLSLLLTKGGWVKCTSDSGTDISFSITNRSSIADNGIFTHRGAMGNLPAGEAFIAPVEESVEGKVVFDGCFDEIDLDGPIEVTISKGKIRRISGGEGAKILSKRIEEAGEKAFYVGEFGIGTNPKARLTPNVLESEKSYGTIHVAFGNNITFGGIINVPFHSDGVVKNPTVLIDGSPILDKGIFSKSLGVTFN